MEKLRIYLDTSVISHLDQPEKPIEQEYSQRLWDAIMDGEYEVFLSDVVFEEIYRCNIDKRSRLQDFINQIDFHSITLGSQARAFADLIIAKGILPAKCKEDCHHIAAALFAECNCLLSWNLKHLANYRTNEKVRIISLQELYKELAIIQPSQLVEGVFENEKESPDLS
jgi:predicted nucleic acid-binding protein